MSQTPQQKIKAMQTMLGRWKSRPVMDYRKESNAAVLARMKIIRGLLEKADELMKMKNLDFRTQRTAKTYAEAAYSIACKHIPTMPRGGIFTVTAADILKTIEDTPLLTDEMKKQAKKFRRSAAAPKKKYVPPEPCKMCRHRQDDYCEAVGEKCKEALHTRGCDAPPEILPPREEHI